MRSDTFRAERCQPLPSAQQQELEDEHTHVLVAVLSPLGPAEAVEGNIGGAVLPAGSEAALGHLGELQVLGGRNHLWWHRERVDLRRSGRGPSEGHL